MRKLLTSVWRWFFPIKEDAPTRAPAPAKRKAVRREKEHFGAHYYLGDLLDALDMTFSHLPAFKRGDREAFNLFQKLGASVMSSDGMMPGQLEPYMLQQMPSFGCYFKHGGSNDEEKIPARFLYFIKEKRPVNVQGTNHTVYRCGATFHLEKYPEAMASQFYVAVSKDGTISPLRVCRPRSHKPGFVRMEWGYPPDLEDWANDNGRTVEEHVTITFAIMAAGALSREAGLTVRVRKNGMAAAFAIDILRTPYFFADRDKTVTENGTTKKIMHLVKGHWRTVAGGERVFVKSHFRGLRKFTWNGYAVTIGLAGKHGLGMSSATFSAADPAEDASDLIGAEKVAELLDEAMV